MQTNERQLLNKCIEDHKQTGHWNRSTCILAASIGDIEQLQLSHTSGAKLCSIATEEAARYGHLDCLDYISKYVDFTKYVYEQAIEGLHLECIQYIEKYYPNLKTINSK